MEYREPVQIWNGPSSVSMGTRNGTQGGTLVRIQRCRMQRLLDFWILQRNYNESDNQTREKKVLERSKRPSKKIKRPSTLIQQLSPDREEGFRDAEKKAEDLTAADDEDFLSGVGKVINCTTTAPSAPSATTARLID